MFFRMWNQHYGEMLASAPDYGTEESGYCRTNGAENPLYNPYELNLSPFVILYRGHFLLLLTENITSHITFVK